MILTIIFCIVINIPLAILVHYLIYSTENKTPVKWMAVVGLVPLIYLNLILMDFNLERFGEIFHNRIKGSEEKDSAIIVTFIIVIISTFYYKSIKKHN